MTRKWVACLLAMVSLAVAPCSLAAQSEDPATVALRAGSTLVSEARFEEALAHYHEAAGADTYGSRYVAAAHGGLLLRLGRTDDAAEVFGVAVEHRRGQDELSYSDVALLMGLAGAHARSGQWKEARDALQTALALPSGNSADEPAVSAALAILDEVDADTPPNHASARIEFALASQDRFDTSYPVSAQAVAVLAGSRLLASGDTAAARATLMRERTFGSEDDCAAEAARLLMLADLYARGTQPQLGAAAAYYDSAAALPARFRAAANVPAGVLRHPADSMAHLPWATILLRQESGLGPRAASMAALAALEHGRTPTAVDSLWGSQPQQSVLAPCASARRTLDATGLADSLAISREGALAWHLHADTVFSFLILPTGELLLERTAVEGDNVRRLAAGAAQDTRAATHLAAVLLPPALQLHMPGRGRILVSPPHGLDVDAAAVLRENGLEGLDVASVPSIAAYVKSTQWQRRRETVAAASAPEERGDWALPVIRLDTVAHDAAADSAREAAAIGLAFGTAVVASPLFHLRDVLGDSALIAVASVPAGDGAELQSARDAVSAAAEASLADGRPREAAVRFERAAVLALRVGSEDDLGEFRSGLNRFCPNEAVEGCHGRPAARAAAVANLDRAADAWSLAGDSARRAQALRSAALLAWDGDLAAAALNSQRNAPLSERVHTALAAESVLRYRDPAMSDSLLLMACRAECGDEAARLASLLQQELMRDHERAGRRSVREAVRVLVASRIADGARALPGVFVGSFPRSALTTALEEAREIGDGGGEATLLHARGEQFLDEVIQLSSERDSARMDLLRAAGIRREAGDAPGAANSLALLAMVDLDIADERTWAVDSARIWIEAAEQAISESTADAALSARVRRRHAQVAVAAGDTAAAERMLREAVAMEEGNTIAIANHRYWMARAYLNAGAGTGALPHARASHESFRADSATEAAARSAEALAEAHSLLGQPDSAAQWLEQVVAFGRASGDPARVAHALSAVAELRLEHGDFEEAERRLDEALAAARERHLFTNSWEYPGNAVDARIANDLGLLSFGLGEWAEARQLFAAAVHLAPMTHPESQEARRNEALAALALADVVNGDSIVRALQWTEASRPAQQRMHPDRPRRRPLTNGWIRVHMAALHAERGELSQIRETVEAAVPLLEEAGHVPSLQHAHAVKGWFFQQLGRPDSAAVWFAAAGPSADRYTAALDSLSAGADTPERLARLLAERRRANDHLGAARVMGRIASHYLRELDHPTAATAWYDSAAATLMALDQSRLTDWERIQLGEQFAAVQQESALAWLAAADELGPATAAAGALAAAERGRGRAFDALTRSIGTGALLGDMWELASYGDRSLPEIGHDLLRERFTYRAYGEPGTTTLSFLQTPDTLLVWLALPTGELSVYREPVSADSMAWLVSSARAAMGVDSAGTRSLGNLEDNPLAALLSDEAEVPPLEAALRQLADVLLPGRLKEVLPPSGELLVVPTGPIAAVPFASLPLDAAGTPLTSVFSVRYVPSLAYLELTGLSGMRWNALPISPSPGNAGADSMNAVRRAWLGRAVVVGNPEMPRVPLPGGGAARLDPLPGAEQEADAVATLLGTEPLLRDAAQLDALIRRLGEATIVHLATHGFAYAREEKVGDSFVALAPGPDDDGLLTVTELLANPALRMPAANLVVLSACQTGLGQLTDSEGTLGLQRAFLATGARSVLVSLWSVSDRATSILLHSFYEHWLQDEDEPSKAEALRRAQEDLRSVPAFSHPRYWAPFQLVGGS